MLLPKKTKFRKDHRGRMRGTAKGQTAVQFGDFGIKALEPGWVTNRQIEAARIAMTVEDLERKLSETRQELFNLRFQSATGALENPARIRFAKREIARVLTVLNEKANV